MSNARSLSSPSCNTHMWPLEKTSCAGRPLRNRRRTSRAGYPWPRKKAEHSHSAGHRTARSGKLSRARSRLYRSQILQVNMRLKALAEIYTMHSFAQLCNLIFLSKFEWCAPSFRYFPRHRCCGLIASFPGPCASSRGRLPGTLFMVFYRIPKVQKCIHLVDLVKSFQTGIYYYLIGNFGVDTAENRPLKVCQQLAICYS